MELPNAQELEEVVLGALILEDSSINKILDILNLNTAIMIIIKSFTEPL